MLSNVQNLNKPVVVYVITVSINLIRNSPIQIEISIRIVIKLLSLNLGCIIAGCHGIQLY